MRNKFNRKIYEEYRPARGSKNFVDSFDLWAPVAPINQTLRFVVFGPFRFDLGFDLRFDLGFNLVSISVSTLF